LENTPIQASEKPCLEQATASAERAKDRLAIKAAWNPRTDMLAEAQS